MSDQSNLNPDSMTVTPEEEKEKIERMNRIRQSLANAEHPAKQNSSDLPKPVQKSGRTQALDISVEDNPPPQLGSEETRSQKLAQIREALAMVERPAAPQPAPPAKGAQKLPPLKKKGSKSASARNAAAETIVTPPPAQKRVQKPAPAKAPAPSQQKPTAQAAKPLGTLPPLKKAGTPAAQTAKTEKPVQAKNTAAPKPQPLPPLKKAGTVRKGEATADMKPVKPKAAPASGSKPAVLPKFSTKEQPAPLGKIAAILGGSAVGALVVAYAIVALVFSNKFLPNTYINDIPVSSMTKEEAADTLLASVRADDLVLVASNGEKAEFEANSYNAYYSLPDGALDEAFGESRFLWIKKLFSDTNYTVEYDFNYSEDTLRSLVVEHDWGNEPAQNAFIQKTADGMYEIVPATVGDRFDKNALMSYVTEQLTVGKTLIEMQESGCYDAFAAQIQEEDLQDQLELCNRFAKCAITFDFSDRTEVLEGSIIADWVYFTESGEIAFNRGEVENFVAAMADKYDTYGRSRSFRSTLDGVITVPWTSTSIYGWQIDQDGTVEQILELLQAGESATVEPKYENWGYAYTRNTDDIGSTYIEVDISAQHVWYYKNGLLQMESDCVTGAERDPERRTPRGIFKIWSHEKNRVLGQMDDEGYETPVNYWMPVNYIGVGLHDATWQGAFGGTRYLDGYGSHGCINLPLSFTKEIYNATENGIPVVIHD